MAGPVGLPVIDPTPAGFPHQGVRRVRLHPQVYQGPRVQGGLRVPLRTCSRTRPGGCPTDDPASLQLQQMDRFGIEKAMIGVGEDSVQLALRCS